MAQAKGQRITRAPLSAIFRDPELQAAFLRAERDQGPEPLATVIFAPPPPPPLSGAAAVDLTAEQRQSIEGQIEWALDFAHLLTAILDASEPDSDLEENGDKEPSLAGFGGDGSDLELDTADDESSLGWSGAMNQDRALRQCSGAVLLPNGQWFGRNEDLEAEHDGREPEEDSEPSLGAPNPAFYIGGLDQRHWGHGSTDDREDDCEGEGACETALNVL